MYSSENNVTGHILGNLAKDGKDCNRVWTRLEVSAPAIAGTSRAASVSSPALGKQLFLFVLLLRKSKP